MATNKQLKFYKVQSLPTTLVVGGIYFEVSTQRICVAKSTTEYDAFGVGLKSAELVDGKLTITRYDDTKVTVDFNDIASATSVQAALNSINDKINVINGDGEGSIKAAVAAEKSRAEGEEAKIRQEFAAADAAAATAASEEYGKIRGELSAAQTTLQGNIDLKADKSTTYTKDEVDGFVNAKANAADVYTKTDADAKVKVVSDALAQEVTDRTNAVTGLQDQIDDLVAGTVDVKHAEADKYIEVTKVEGTTTYTVASKGIDDAISAAVGTETANRESAISTLQDEVDGIEAKVNTLVGSDADKTVRAIAAEEVAAQLIPETAGEALDTLQEIAAWIQAHPGDASAMNADIETLKTKVGEKAVNVQISEAISALSDEDKSSEDANLIKVTVSQADGNVTAVSVNDEALDAKFKSTDDAVALNTAAVADYKTRIEALESTSDSLDATYVKSADYATDKAALAQKDIDLQGEIDAAEGRLDVVEGDISTIKGEQTTQNSAIEAAAALGQQGIDDASAALTEAQAKVASVTSNDSYVSVDNTDAKNPKLSLNVTGEIAENNTGLVTGGTIFNALCWAEFD